MITDGLELERIYETDKQHLSLLSICGYKYSQLGNQKIDDVRSKERFARGNYYENQFYYALIKKYGKENVEREHEITTVVHDIKFVGHIDFVLKDTTEINDESVDFASIIEFKSTAKFSDDLVELYLKQLMAYYFTFQTETHLMIIPVLVIYDFVQKRFIEISTWLGEFVRFENDEPVRDSYYKDILYYKNLFEKNKEAYLNNRYVSGIDGIQCRFCPLRKECIGGKNYLRDD